MSEDNGENPTLHDDDSLVTGDDATYPSNTTDEFVDEDAQPTPPRVRLCTSTPPLIESQPGRIIADRYELIERLGAGGHGEVWTANDRVLREPVALKWMRYTEGQFPARIRREIATLRMLRVPGVVRLLDEGIDDGRPFLVMEHVRGKPFPGGRRQTAGGREEGRETKESDTTTEGTEEDRRTRKQRERWSWQDVVGPTVALLEVLSRVHAAGVVHLDLKPDNVLVSDEGLPTVLDFGIVHWQDPTNRTARARFAGTPRYMAPEQIRGTAVDARTDLYALGVILYEALTGNVPHTASNWMLALEARANQPASPILEASTDVPAAVARIVDRLLALHPDQRFRSANAVLGALRGETVALRHEPVLPRLGDDRAVQAILDAVLARRSIDIVGPSGSGRTRCLQDAAEALERQGRQVAWPRPAHTPFASLRQILLTPALDDQLRLRQATTVMETRLSAALAGGLIVMADDVEQLDSRSAALLERCQNTAAGTIVRAMKNASHRARPRDVIQLEPLDELALQPLFAGPDRLFHLREDATRALWERTQGWPNRIEAEVTLWTRLGLARWDGAMLVVERDALSRLNASLPAVAVTPPPSSLKDEPHLIELLRWLALGGEHVDLTQLAQVMDQPLWKIEADCEALVGYGVARWIDGPVPLESRTASRDNQRVVVCGQVDLTWPDQQRQEAHRKLARVLRPGQEGRLLHLLAGEQTEGVAAESIETARAHATEGRLGDAAAALTEGLRVVSHQKGDVARVEELRILEESAKVAFAQGMPTMFDRVLYELSRSACHGPDVDRLEALLRAALAAPGASGPQAIKLAEGIPPFTDPHLEWRRQRVRVIAASRSSATLLEEVLADLAKWAEGSTEPLAHLSLTEGRAILMYAKGRFKEAAILHAEVARQEPWLPGQIAATLKSASALLEAFQHQEAVERAATGQDLAARCRHVHWEGRAEWLLRSAMYRLSEIETPDLELIDAVTRLGVQDLEALVCLNEAAVAYRAGLSTLARELSMRAARQWKELDRSSGELLSRCLALACGAAAQEGEVEALAKAAMEVAVTGVGVQALGLLGQAFPDTRASWKAEVNQLVEGIPRDCWGLRMDVLSVEESLQGMGVALS